MAEHFDLVILGSGSTAFAAALRAAELGKTAAMTEVRTLGGTCVSSKDSLRFKKPPLAAHAARLSNDE